IIECCEKAGVKLSIVPFYADYMPAHPQFDDLNGIPLMNIRRIPLDNFANAFIKRAMDIAGALMMLLLSSPFLLIAVIGIKLSSPGPILFRQVRVGRNRKPFTLFKLRTMRVNTEESSAWSKKEDGRRTRFGSLLRKISLDEVPQALNILRGDMSLVGPRPELPIFVDRFKNEIPLYMVRHQVRPGLTGWAQINGFRGDTPIKERAEHDIYYIENWSLWFDIQILLATVFKGKFINDETLQS
ncbi:MAG: exopolysaccharide biosynthesis polyprenyl glycosylphosphotransferase, partial [Oscillospiraceae bacterium]|nr:exopolysaccharide biosynthesis polyprenyl glycosylphosphotransferase [Oscillospiraceae bacterium]